VAAKAARRAVQIRAYADRIVVLCDGEVVADHRLPAEGAGATLCRAEHGWSLAA